MAGETLEVQSIACKVGYVLTTTVAFDCLESIRQSSLELIPSNLVNFAQQSGKIWKESAPCRFHRRQNIDGRSTAQGVKDEPTLY